MPDFVLNRNFTLRTLAGRIVNFEKGVPTFVPPMIVKDALTIGAEPCDGKMNILEEEAAPPPAVPVGEEREQQVFLAFDLISERNERGNFTAQGVPTVDAVEHITGFKITKKEQQSYWQAYREAKGAE